MLRRFKNLSRIFRSLALLSPLVAACFVLYAAGLCGLIRALLKRNWHVAFVALTCITIAFSVVMKKVIFPPIVYERTMKPFMARVNEKIDPKIPLLFYRGFDYGAVFYAGRHIPLYRNKTNELKPPLYLLMWEEDWQRLKERDDLTLRDVSEGRGPAGRHRLTLVEYQPSAISLPERLPIKPEDNTIDDTSD